MSVGLLVIMALLWASCGYFALYARRCMRRAEDAVPWTEGAAERAEAAAVMAKNAADRASGFRRTRQGLR